MEQANPTILTDMDNTYRRYSAHQARIETPKILLPPFHSLPHPARMPDASLTTLLMLDTYLPQPTRRQISTFTSFSASKWLDHTPT